MTSVMKPDPARCSEEKRAQCYQHTCKNSTSCRTKEADSRFLTKEIDVIQERKEQLNYTWEVGDDAKILQPNSWKNNESSQDSK